MEDTYKTVEDGWSSKDRAQVLTEGRQSASGSTARIVNVGLWILQIGAAGMFLMVGFFKLSGDPRMVGLFEAIGIGQWFRYVTGIIEVASAMLLLIPALSGIVALFLVPMMIAAILTHLLIIGGSRALPVGLLIVVSVVAWGRAYLEM